MAEPFGHCIKQHTYIAAAAEKVFDVITSAAGWDASFTTGMTLDLKPGGDCTFRWENWGPDFYTLAAPGKVVAVERPGKFAFQWGSDPVRTITFNLSAEMGGTVIRLTEDGYLDTPEGRSSILECASGWGEALTLLKFYIEHGIVYTPPVKDA
jgi:uncharacterized protein YndB with AHSA1/START domain